MSAIITETFRKNNAKAFLNEISTNDFYVGIGKSEPWEPAGLVSEDDPNYNVLSPLGNAGDINTVKQNLTTLIGILDSDCSRVIPKVITKSGVKHKTYNPFSLDCFYATTVGITETLPCYNVVGDKVYLCLKAGTDSTFVPDSVFSSSPSGISRTPVVFGDSVWVYIYKYSSPINIAQFISVPDNATLAVGETNDDIANATGNLVFGFTVIEGGSGYHPDTTTANYIPSNSPFVSIPLDVTIVGGIITSISYVDPSFDFEEWSNSPGYVEIIDTDLLSPGTNAIAYPNIAPPGGFGLYPADDLPTSYVGIKTSAIDTIGGDGAFIPYRQISIVKNPTTNGLPSSANLHLRCLSYLEFDLDAPNPSLFETGTIFTQGAAKGIIDYYDSEAKLLYYHQNYITGFREITADPISINGDPSTPIALPVISEYEQGSGQVLFTQNRKKINRSEGQQEDITIILQF